VELREFCEILRFAAGGGFSGGAVRMWRVTAAARRVNLFAAMGWSIYLMRKVGAVR
jgi:hypothetical protein